MSELNDTKAMNGKRERVTGRARRLEISLETGSFREFRQRLRSALLGSPLTWTEISHKIGLRNIAAQTSAMNYLQCKAMPTACQLAKLEFALDLPVGALYAAIAGEVISEIRAWTSSPDFANAVQEDNWRFGEYHRNYERNHRIHRRKSNVGTGEDNS